MVGAYSRKEDHVDTRIRLLGRPGALQEDREVEVRGHKVWLLLALLLLSESRVSRERLARLLFVDAVDAGAALRWNLSQLRRLGVQLDGDPVHLRLPAEVTVDIDLLLRGHADVAAALPGLDDDLLAGMRVESGTELAVWLEEERRHLRRLAIDIRQEAALTLLGRGDIGAALAYARQVAEASPLDENTAALLVRCLRAAGRSADARAVAHDAAARLRDELGVEPTGALWSAVAATLGGDRRVTGWRAVVAQIEAGESAVNAGAVDAGVTSLQGAVIAARAIGDSRSLARSLVALGSALIHGVRGVDQEGLALLHEAIPLTNTVDDANLAVTARREIGYVDFLRGRYDRAGRWFSQARKIAGASAGELGWVDLYDGASADDVGDLPRAERLLLRTLESAEQEGDLRLKAFGLTMLGRHHLVRDDVKRAARHLENALTIVRGFEWTAFRPFPEALLADAVRRTGDLAQARDLAEHAYVLGEQVGDPCWESLALRSLGLISVDAGDLAGGLALLEEAPLQCRRLPDTYRWIELWGYEARRSREPLQHAIRHGVGYASGGGGVCDGHATPGSARTARDRHRGWSRDPRGCACRGGVAQCLRKVRVARLYKSLCGRLGRDPELSAGGVPVPSFPSDSSSSMASFGSGSGGAACPRFEGQAECLGRGVLVGQLCDGAYDSRDRDAGGCASEIVAGRGLARLCCLFSRPTSSSCRWTGVRQPATVAVRGAWRCFCPAP
jgi:DNA-binding SARP family transcriptional activator